MELKINILFIVAALITVSIAAENKTQTNSRVPVTVTRTELKVSRSIDPEKTQTLKVLTKTGDVATLIVKKRDGKTTSSTESDLKSTTALPVSTKMQPVKNEPNEQMKSFDQTTIRSEYGDWLPVSSVIIDPKVMQFNQPKVQDYQNVQQVSENDYQNIQTYSEKKQPSVIILSSDQKPGLKIKSQINELKNYLQNNQYQNSEPKNIFITSETYSSNYVPAPVNIRSENIFVKSQPDSKRSRSLIKIGSDGIPVIHGERMPDDENDKIKTWRNARVINGELVPYEKGYTPQRAVPLGELVYAKQVDTDSSERKNENKGIGPFSTYDNYATSQSSEKSNVGPFTINDNRDMLKSNNGNNWDYVGNRNNYVRFTSSGGFGPFTKADNSRIANSKLIDYIKEINEREAKRDYFSRRQVRDSEYPSVKFPESSQIQRRMLHYPGSTNFPNSQLYTSSSTKLKPVNFIDGVRTPVLQYAHPELGVQPVEVPVESEMKHDTLDSRAKLYFSKDIHSDRSPYLTEPVEQDGRQAGDYNGRKKKYYDSQSSHGPVYYRKDYNSPYNNGYYVVKHQQDQPFWMQITESIKENFKSGFQRMQQVTKPVFDPIMEATHKIGYNLGLTKTPPHLMAQEKIGGPVMTGSVIIPAIGLVAGGAALGLGAAAVGRYLDVGLMRSSQNGNEEYLDQAEMEHKRAMQMYENNNYGNPRDENVLVILESEQGKIPHYNMRQRRDLRTQQSPELDVVEAIGNGYPSLRRTKRTNLEDADEMFVLQHLASDASSENGVQNEDLQHLAHAAHWTNTPCAKRLFCDVMVRQNTEQIAFMEKRMDTFMRLVHPVVAQSVSYHLHDVMDAVKRHDCSQFVCNEKSI